MTSEEQLAKTISKAISDISGAISGIVASQLPPEQSIAESSRHLVIESEPDLMTKQDVAKFLKISVRSVDNWMRSGFLPHYRVGRVVRFRQKDIVARLDERYRLIGRRSRGW